MEYKNIKVNILNATKSIEYYYKYFDKIINNNENVVRLFINKNKCWGEAFKISPITCEKIFFTVSNKGEQMKKYRLTEQNNELKPKLQKFRLEATTETELELLNSIEIITSRNDRILLHKYYTFDDYIEDYEKDILFVQMCDLKKEKLHLLGDKYDMITFNEENKEFIYYDKYEYFIQICESFNL